MPRMAVTTRKNGFSNTWLFYDRLELKKTPWYTGIDFYLKIEGINRFVASCEAESISTGFLGGGFGIRIQLRE